LKADTGPRHDAQKIVVATTRRDRRRGLMIAAMGNAPPTPLTVSVESAGTPITGRVLVGGQPERPFTGWVGLVAALDDAIRALQQRNGDE
jgi:hypothetical protein